MKLANLCEKEQYEAILLYQRVRRATKKGKEAIIREKKDGELCVFSHSLHIVEDK